MSTDSSWVVAAKAHESVMRGAVGEPLSSKALLSDARKAIDALQ